MGATEALDPFDHQGIGAGSVDPRAHRFQAVGQVHHFGFPGGVLDHRGALGQRGGHQQVFGAGHRDQVQYDVRTPQAAGAGANVAVLDLDVGAHRFQSLDVQVDWPRADGAAAWQRHFGLTKAGQQWSQYQDRGAHGTHQLVRGLEGLNRARVHLDAHPLVDHQVHAHATQQLHGGGDILQVRDVANDDRLVGQQGGGQNRQHRVLGAGGAQLAEQRYATIDDEFAHENRVRRSQDCSVCQVSGV